MQQRTILFKRLCLPGIYATAIMILATLEAFAQNAVLSRQAIRAALSASEDRATSDPNRPVYHFMPEANWMNDPNGGFYHDGWYHVFYLWDPHDEDGLDSDGYRSNRVWGHARSEDLVYWERLPAALLPSRQDGELKPISGGSLLRGDSLTVMYTSIPMASGNPDGLPTQWIAGSSVGSGFEKFDKSASNPVLRPGHDGVPEYDAWRDPFLFEHGGSVYMIIGATRDSKATLPLFRAERHDLTQWSHLGNLLEIDTTETRFFECPELYPVGEGRWLLIYSPMGPVRYCVGTLDIESPSFDALHCGLIDHSDEHYASEIIAGPKDNLTLIGWVPGWGQRRNNGVGWNGSLSIPRTITVTRQGRIVQRPALGMRKLRRSGVHLKRRRLRDGTSRFPKVEGDVLEVRAVFREESATAYGLRLRVSDNGRRMVEIRKEGEALYVDGQAISLVDRGTDDGSLVVHAFLDKSLLEVFVNEGRACITKKLYPQDDDMGIEFYSEGGTVMMQSLDVWEMRSIW